MIISESKFKDDLLYKLNQTDLRYIESVTGPGRSGAIISAYISHITGIPFIPYGQGLDKRVLICDTTQHTGKTIRKAQKKYNNSEVFYLYDSPPIPKFWYERGNNK